MPEGERNERQNIQLCRYRVAQGGYLKSQNKRLKGQEYEIGLELRIWLHLELRALIISSLMVGPRRVGSSEKGLRKLPSVCL